MIRHLLLIIGVIAFIGNTSSGSDDLQIPIDDSTFCRITGCDCKNTKVICTTYDIRLKQIMYHDTAWLDEEFNQSYPIKDLEIHGNELVSINREFPDVELEKLDLSENSIVNISNAVFKKLQKLTVLILSNNEILNLNPEAFKGDYSSDGFTPLVSLEEIRLDHNNFHSLDGDLFEHTPNVKRLYIGHNPLSVIDHQTAISITSLVYLEHLDLSGTGLSSLPEYFLHTPKYLKTLNLSGNQFDGIPQGLSDSMALESLVLNNNPIVNLTNKNGFPTIKTLKVLHLSHMHVLREIGNGSMSNLQNLEELHITDNIELTIVNEFALSYRKSIEDFESFPPIKKLFLNNNQISYLDMHFLGRWEPLIDLDISDNPWTCECENQWLVDELILIYNKINSTRAQALKCAAPIEMIDYTFYQLFVKKEQMRCLDLYGARPERDAGLLVGILAGILLGIPLVLLVLYAYKRQWFGLFDDSPAAFSRQFYSSTKNTEDADF